MYSENNIEYILQNKKNYISENINLPLQMQREFVMSDEKTNTTYYKDYYNNVYEVTEELQEKISPNKYKREVFFFLGIDSWVEIKEMYKKKHADTIFVIIEPNISIFSHILSNENLSIFNDSNVYLYVNHEVEELNNFIPKILENYQTLKFINNVKYYINAYYRRYDNEIISKYMVGIRHSLVSMIERYGNSMEDGLIGLKNHIKNIDHIFKSKDLSFLAGKFTNLPAYIVSAGPSLDKNIRFLKKAKNRGVIIAVDTIVEKLLKEGITPDFMTTVERIPLVYDYFYKNKNLPKEITLVAPSVLDERIFDEFKGNYLIPIRIETGEGKWLKSRLQLPPTFDMLMGLSCAHVAFGLAFKLGCSPIVLIGQDLAFGEDSKTHVSGTEYDNESELEKVEEIERQYEYVKGYYNEVVKTTPIWLQFKSWFEIQIQQYNLDVVNATEGGVHIYGTRQIPLKDVIDFYEKKDIALNLYDFVDQLPSYKFNMDKIIENFSIEIEGFKNFRDDCLLYVRDLNELEKTLFSCGNFRELLSIEKFLQTIDLVIPQIIGHELLSHNFQFIVFQYYWKINSVEEIVSKDNLDYKRKAQINLLLAIIYLVDEVITNVENLIEQIKIEKESEKNRDFKK